MIDVLLIGIGALGLLVGTFTDLRTREVADWLNYFLIASGLLLRFIHSVSTGEWSFLGWGVVGLLAGVAIGHLMYYTGQWGGGDAKMLMGLGALFATWPWASVLSNSVLDTPMVFLGFFFIHTMLAGAVLGILYSIYLAIAHYKSFSKTITQMMNTPAFRYSRYTVWGVCLALVLGAVFTQNWALRSTILMLAVLLILSLYIMTSIKAVEKGCMIQKISKDKLVEGDWIAKEIKHKGKLVVNTQNTGITRQQIKVVMQSPVKFVWVKVGMPFIPAFLLGFVFTLLLGGFWWQF